MIQILVAIYVQAFVSEICYPITNQNFEQAKINQPFLQDLNLADFNPGNLPLNVDILIGGDYWSFMNNHMKRNRSGGLTAISSKLGYILSGTVLGTNMVENSVNVVNTHVLKNQVEFINEKKELTTLAKGFWDLETLGIKDQEEKRSLDTYAQFNLPMLEFCQQREKKTHTSVEGAK